MSRLEPGQPPRHRQIEDVTDWYNLAITFERFHCPVLVGPFNSERPIDRGHALRPLQAGYVLSGSNWNLLFDEH